jgi:acetyl-CoA acetyltransferase
MLELFEGGLDQLRPETWKRLYGELAPTFGATFAPRPERITLLDATALTAAWHQHRYGTTPRALAAVSSKNHGNGAKNPNAQYQQAMSIDEVLADKSVLAPFTRAMCAPIGDGAAAALVCSGGPEPQSQQVLSLNVTVPVGATALVALPLLAGVAPGNASVTESGAAVWAKGVC